MFAHVYSVDTRVNMWAVWTAALMTTGHSFSVDTVGGSLLKHCNIPQCPPQKKTDMFHFTFKLL